MDLPILVDSNIYIELLRRNRDPVTELTEKISQMNLATCGMVRVEVLRGIMLPKAKARMTAFFDVLQNVPTDNRLWNEAAELAWTMDRKGWVIPAQDILIACCARRIGAVLLTQDKHFKNIPNLAVGNFDF